MNKDRRPKLAVSPSLITLLEDKYPDETITSALNNHLFNTLNTVASAHDGEAPNDIKDKCK